MCAMRRVGVYGDGDGAADSGDVGRGRRRRAVITDQMCTIRRLKIEGGAKWLWFKIYRGRLRSYDRTRT